MIELNKIYNEDCLQGMQRIDDESIDLVVTSPPYDNLRTYGKDIDKTWGEHIWKPILKELYRVVKQGGVVVWVVGDATINGSETGTSFKQALFAMECGFNLHDTMIWKKSKLLPRDTRIPRYWQEFEYMFVFSKEKPLHFTFHREHCKHANKPVMAYGGRCGELDKLRLDRKEKNKDHKVLDTKPRGNIWTYATMKVDGHPAPFPLNLAQDHITSWSNENDVVLDPFIGSGTTAIAAIRNHRNFIGFELNKEYFDKANERIKRELAEPTIF